jgi:di/tricarboxylate transporter
MLDVQGWYTIGVITLMFIALYREYVGADFVVFGALVALWLGGVVDTDQALSGFHNPMVIAIAMLFIISAALQQTGAVSMLSAHLLSPNAHPRRSLPRLAFPVAALSSFMNNTPIVALLTPTVRDWAVRNGQSPSKFLIPLSYSAILGGTCTLIGTSTNLTVSGLIVDAGHAPIGMFELTPVGVPLTIAGVLFMTFLAPRLLPDRRTPEMQAESADREYAVVLEVAEDCPLIGKSVEQAGLRNLSGLFLAEILRGNRRIVPVRPTMELARGDRLVLFGLVDTVVELRKTQGLIPVADVDDDGPGSSDDANLFEVVISENSPLVGQNLRDAGFRRRYDAAVIAIHRGGERLNEKLGDVELRPGDTLMVEAAPGFRRTWANSTHFYLVSAVDASERPRYRLANFAMLNLIGMVVLVTAGILSIAKAAAVVACILVWFRCIRPDEARRSINLSVLLVIASAFGISHAVRNSGVADLFGVWVSDSLGGAPPWMALAVIWIATVIATEALSNAAAAAMIIPIALSTAEGLSRDPRPFVVAVTLAASMSFITPVGYQTNLVVYGPGGYRFSDFARVGIPMSILVFAVAMALIPMIWGWG